MKALIQLFIDSLGGRLFIGNENLCEIDLVGIAEPRSGTHLILLHFWDVQEVLTNAIFRDIRLLSNERRAFDNSVGETTLITAVRFWCIYASGKHHIPNTPGPLAPLRISTHPLLLSS